MVGRFRVHIGQDLDSGKDWGSNGFEDGVRDVGVGDGDGDLGCCGMS